MLRLQSEKALELAIHPFPLRGDHSTGGHRLMQQRIPGHEKRATISVAVQRFASELADDSDDAKIPHLKRVLDEEALDVIVS